MRCLSREKENKFQSTLSTSKGVLKLSYLLHINKMAMCNAFNSAEPQQQAFPDRYNLIYMNQHSCQENYT